MFNPNVMSIPRKFYESYLIESDNLQPCFSIERSRDVSGSRLRSNLKQDINNKYFFKKDVIVSETETTQ